MDKDITSQNTVLFGTVSEVLFYNQENGYIVFIVETDDDYETVVGELGRVDVGEKVAVTGNFITHAKFGRQFRATYCEKTLPDKSEDIYNYLASGVIKGIGKSLALKIVDIFGDNSLDIIENEPERLTEVKGITRKKVDEISAEYQKINGIRALIAFLSKYEIKPQLAIYAWKKWGRYAVDVISNNPYMLCEYGIELDFLDAEKVAAKMEIAANSIERIKAGINYVLFENSYAGNSCVPYDKLVENAVKILKITTNEVEDTIELCCKDETLYIYKKGEKQYVFLHDYFKAEEYIAARINVLNSFLKDTEYDYNELIDLEEATKEMKYADLQREAISIALSKGFVILTGGPGTGKTTTLEAIISLYEQRGMKVMIAAPTGKAAKRISELTGYEAKTIHRLLEVVFDNMGKPIFKHNEQDQIDCDVIIVDEMSMVDTLLFEALLRALKLSCRLILVGDDNQLPSVGAGNVLKDMLDSEILSVIKLTEIFRQAQLSAIVTNAHKIVHGDDIELGSNDNDFFFLQSLEGEKASKTVVDLICTRLPKAYGYSPINDIQILSPSRKGITGVYELNKAVQAVINPAKKGKNEINSYIYTFRENDKVIQTKNNYDIIWSKDGEQGTGIFNGDIGIIQKISKKDNKIVIDFDGRVAEYTSDMLDKLELAYTITVHKSQGSEFEAVILTLLGGFPKLYYRNLLYTAVTRAKKLLVIVGSKNAVTAMIENNRRSLRYSCLTDMIIKECGSR